MPSMKIPAGANRVALGDKSKGQKQKRKEAFAVHKPGKHTEAEHGAVENTSARRPSLKPQIRNLDGGSDAKVR
jgi:hypothetical protein